MAEPAAMGQADGTPIGLGADAPEQPASRMHPSRVLLVAASVHTCNDAMFAVMYPLLPLIAADLGLSEGVKWNAPSFLIGHHFATFKLHPPKQVQIVFHTDTGAKKPPPWCASACVSRCPSTWRRPRSRSTWRA